MRRQHIFLWIILSSGILFPYFSYASQQQIPTLSCSYAGKFTECMQAQKSGATRDIPGCIASNDMARVLDNLILDETFTEKDEWMDTYLESLQESKGEYFWKDKQASFLEGVDAIENNFWVEGAYYREFESLCNGGILEERLWCSDAIADVEASRILKEWVGLQKSVCMQLVTQKLENYKTVAGNIMKENKVAVQEDAKQLQTQQRREKYSQVWFSFFQTLGSIGEFLGLTHFTPFPY